MIALGYRTDWLYNMGIQESQPNPCLPRDVESHISQQNRCVFRRLFFLLFLVKIGIHEKVLWWYKLDRQKGNNLYLHKETHPLSLTMSLQGGSHLPAISNTAHLNVVYNQIIIGMLLPQQQTANYQFINCYEVKMRSLVGEMERTEMQLPWTWAAVLPDLCSQLAAHQAVERATCSTGIIAISARVSCCFSLMIKCV